MARLEPGVRANCENRRANHAPGNCRLASREARGIQGQGSLPRATREVAQGTSRNGGEVGILVREDVAGGRKACHYAGVSPLEHRHNLVAHVGAQVAGVSVCIVLAPHDAAHAQELAELVVRAVEQRAHHAVAAAWDGREARGTGAADGVHHEGLGAVVGRVGSEDARSRAGRTELGRELVGQAGGLAVAHLSAGVLHVAVRRGRGQRGHVHAADGTGNAVAGREVANELLVLVGVDAAQAVVHVEHVETLAGDAGAAAAVLDVERGGCRQHQEGRGVRATGDHEHHGRAQGVVGAAGRALEGGGGVSRAVSASNAWHVRSPPFGACDGAGCGRAARLRARFYPVAPRGQRRPPGPPPSKVNTFFNCNNIAPLANWGFSRIIPAGLNSCSLFHWAALGSGGVEQRRQWRTPGRVIVAERCNFSHGHITSFSRPKAPLRREILASTDLRSDRLLARKAPGDTPR